MFSFRNIDTYHIQLKNNETNCTSAVQFYLEKISSHKHLNAFVEVYADEALKHAALLDAKRKTGAPMKRLHGVVIALKDVICYKDHRLSAASGMLKDFVSIYTATAIQYVLDEEAIIIGNCNCDEFAMGSSNENSVYGPVLNAADNTRVSGGSSGGSAVAVQAGMCMVSLGSDTGGSVRQPADFCGIFGLKPGYGRISRYGLIAYASSFDQIGIFGNSIPDIALMLEVLSQPDGKDTTMDKTSTVADFSNLNSLPQRKMRFCYFKQMMEHPSVDKEISTAIKTKLDELKKGGHNVEEIEFDLLDHIVPAYYVLTTAEASSNLGRYDGIRFGHRTTQEVGNLTEFYLHNRSEGFGWEVKRRIMLGTFVLSAGYYEAYFSKAQQVRRMLIDQIKLIFNDFDAILMPVSPTTAFKIGEGKKDPISMYLADIFTVFANLTGLPAIAIPLFEHSNGMPFGVQVLTDKGNELTLLEAGRGLSS